MKGDYVSIVSSTCSLVPGTANDQEVVPFDQHGRIVSCGIVGRADSDETGESPFQQVG